MNLHFVPVFAATAKLGAVFTPIDPRLEPSGLLDRLQIASPSLVVIDDERATLSRELGAELGVPMISLSRLVRTSAGDDDRELAVAGPSELDPQAMFFSSGETGRPKGAVLSHRVHVLRTQPDALPGSRGHSVCPYPLTDPIAWEVALRQWQVRGRVTLVDSTSGPDLCAAIEAHEPTHLTTTLPLLREMLAAVGATSEEERPDQLSSLRDIEVRSAAAPSSLSDEIAAVLPDVRLRLLHGTVEAGGLGCLEGDDLRRKPGSCGVPGPFGELIIERTGELCARGPLLFDGYFGDADATAATVVDGWFHTGDVAEIDPEGYLTILGPIRDIIRTKAGAVAPIEVETALAGHFGVGDVAVVGLLDEDLGQIVCAVVVPAPGHGPPLLSDLRSFCEGRIVSFKQPNRLIIVDTIPRTETTKQVKRPLLRAQLG